MSESELEQTTKPRSKWFDFWTLHVPLVVVLAISISATIIEYNRAMEGIGRAWAYTFQWPLIGVFGIIVWNRYRKHGNLTKGFTRYFHERAARFTAEAEAEERAEAERLQRERELRETPEAQAWDQYVRELHRKDPPGGPPTSG